MASDSSILLRDTRVRLWTGLLADEPSIWLPGVSNVRILSLRNQWRSIQLVDGSYTNIKVARRIDLTIDMTLRFSANLISLVNSDDDQFLRVSWRDDDTAGKTAIANLLCEQGKIESAEFNITDNSFANIKLNYFANTYTLGLG